MKLSIERLVLKFLSLELPLKLIDLLLAQHLLLLTLDEDFVTVLLTLELRNTTLDLWEHLMLSRGHLESSCILLQFLLIMLALGQNRA